MRDERKIDRHWVETLVDHRLGEVQRGHPGSREPCVVEQNLMHAGPVAKGRRHHVAQLRAHIIGREHRVARGLRQPVRAMRQHIGERAREHAHLAMKSRDAAKALRSPDILLEAQSAVLAYEQRRGREGREARRQNDGAGARTAAAVRGGEGLVQINVHRVDAEIARTRQAGDRVEIGAVAIKIAAGVAYHLGDLGDVALE